MAVRGEEGGGCSCGSEVRDGRVDAAMAVRGGEGGGMQHWQRGEGCEGGCSCGSEGRERGCSCAAR